jgi:hypothetical protein
VRRYERIWIPLLREYIKANGGKNDESVCKVICIPPLDVAYIWHVHRLDPNYPSYCKQALGRVAVPTNTFAFSTTSDAPMLWSRWKVNEPFYPPHPHSKGAAHWSAARRPIVDSSLEPHLKAAVKRQASFGHMFLRLCYQDRAYLEQVRPPALCVFCTSSPLATAKYAAFFNARGA